MGGMSSRKREIEGMILCIYIYIPTIMGLFVGMKRFSEYGNTFELH